MSPPLTKLQQKITFDLSKPLGLGVDDLLEVQRINDPESSGVLKAQYCLVRWRVVAVDGQTVEAKASLVEAIEVARQSGKKVVELTFETERQVEPEPSYVSAVQKSAMERNRLASEAMKAERPLKCARQEDVAEEEQEECAEAKKILQLGSELPTFDLAGESVTRIITGSCTWQLEPGDTTRTDVAVRACAAYTVLGCRTFDCGDIYAGVEELVGRFLATARGHYRELAERVRLHTKVIPDIAAPVETLPRRITASVLRSANRLGVSKLDLVHLHWWDWSSAGLATALEALGGLRKSGLVSAIGLTNVDTERFVELFDAGGAPVSCVQVNLSLVDRRPIDSGLVSAAADRNVALLAHGCLCGGLISDSWLDKPSPDVSDLPPGQASNRVLIEEFGGWSTFQKLLHTLRQVADNHQDCTIAQVAIAWTLRLPGVSAVVLGARDAAHVERAAKAAADEVELRPHELEEIEQCVRGRGPVGPVYGLERRASHVLSTLSGSGADGTLGLPVNRAASKAATGSQLDECARRLAQLHVAYQRTMPPIPDLLKNLIHSSNSDEHHPYEQPWMARSAYEYLTTAELVKLLRGFVNEVDCIAEPHENTKHLRTFAARMLASAEQALFVEEKENKKSSPRAAKPSHANITTKTRSVTSAAFRNRVLLSCKRAATAAAGASSDNGMEDAQTSANDDCYVQ